MKKIIATLALGAVVALGFTSTASASIPSSAKYCGASKGHLGLMANKNTTCSFARSVDRAYNPRVAELRPNMWMPKPAYTSAHSSATHRSYTMYCRTVFTRDSPYVTCTGGNSAQIWIVS